MFDAAKLLKVLPHLSDYGKDVESWIGDFSKTMELYDIVEPRRVFTWAKEAVEEDIKGAINSLKIKEGKEIRYPNFKEIQAAIEDHLHITESDKCSVLKSLRINNDESIKKFNYRYKKLYKKLNAEYRRLLTVKDYTNSIAIRVFPCSRVIVAECESLNEAFKIAEVAEEAEREIFTNTRQTNLNSNIGPSVMITQSSMNGNPLVQHPFYGEFHNGQQGNYINPNSFRPPRRNNKMFTNNQWNNNYNNMNSYPNFQINNLKTNSLNYQNNTRNFKDSGYNRINNDRNRLMNINYANVNQSVHIPENLHRNNGNYNKNNYMINNNNMMNNYLQPSRNNQSSNLIFNNDPSNLININKTNEATSGKPSNNKYVNNNYVNITTDKKRIQCYRCTLSDHKAADCPYTFQQLAEMEAKGIIKLPLNL